MSARAGGAWLALDIGGANIKAAHSGGSARTIPFELWKRPEELPRVLEAMAGVFPPFDRLAMTMTAELCDCYATKVEGVSEVVGATLSLAPQESIRVWSTQGRFLSVSEVLRNPEEAAAANWLALAMVAGRFARPGAGILIDVGTTTTDLIPLRDGKPVPRGRTDTERLRTGELVYAGVRRTPFCAVAHELPWRGAMTGVAAELFATTLDVYLTLGRIAEDEDDTLTADGRPATKEGARGRLARMVGADSESFTDGDARELAEAADMVLTSRLISAALRGCAIVGRPESAIACGSGGFLAARVAEVVVVEGGTVVTLEEAWGLTESAAGCARALLVLAQEEERSTE